MCSRWAVWQRDDVHDAMRWLGDITLFEASFWPQVLDQVILSARVASAAGDAGLRARVLQATELLERERRRSRCSPGWPSMPAESSNVMPRYC